MGLESADVNKTEQLLECEEGGKKKNAAFCVGQSYIISHFDSIPVRLGKNNTSAHQEGF